MSIHLLSTYGHNGVADFSSLLRMKNPQVWEYEGVLFLLRARLGTDLQIEKRCLTMPDDKLAFANMGNEFDKSNKMSNYLTD